MSSKIVLIAGASGLIGNALVAFLKTKGYEIVRLSYTKKGKDSLYWNPYESIIPIDDFAKIDIVINLTGENINQLWTKAAKKRIYESRIKSTELLANAIYKAKKKPQLFINASGASCYLTDRNKASTEESPLSMDNSFLTQVIRDWEATAQIIRQTETRLILLRTGMVLSNQGGALQSFLPIFKYNLGGWQGSGKQLISWIGIDDLINAIWFCITQPDIAGPVNMVAPDVVNNKQFAKILAKTLHKPCWLKTPKFLLKLLLGEFAKETILSDCNVYPQKLMNHHFQFQFGTLECCLKHLLISKH